MASAWPPFVTLHDKDTASDLTVEVWHRCCTEWKEETVTEKFWRDQGWLPHPDEDPAAKQNKMRKKKKNTARARKLRKALKSDYNPFSTVGKREADADDDQPNLVQSILDVDVETLVSAAPALFCSRETTPRGSPPPLQAPGLDVMREHIRLDTTLDVSNDLLMSVFGSLPPQLPPSGLAPEQLSMVGHLEYAVLTASLEQPSTSNQTGVSMASSLSSLGCERVLENILPAYETTAQLVFMDGLQRAGYGPRHFQTGSIVICARLPRVLFDFLQQRRASTSADSASQDLLLGPLLDLKLQAVMQFGTGSEFLQLDYQLPEQEVVSMKNKMAGAASICTPTTSISRDVDLVYYIRDPREANERLAKGYSAAVIEILMKAWRQAGNRFEDQLVLQQVFDEHEQRQRSVELSQRVLSESALAQAARSRESLVGSDFVHVSALNDSQTPEGNRMRRGEAAPGSASADLSESFEVAGQHSHNGPLPAQASSSQTVQPYTHYLTPSDFRSWPVSPPSSAATPSWLNQAKGQLDSSVTPVMQLAQWMIDRCGISSAEALSYAAALHAEGVDSPADLKDYSLDEFPATIKKKNHKNKLLREAALGFQQRDVSGLTAVVPQPTLQPTPQPSLHQPPQSIVAMESAADAAHSTPPSRLTELPSVTPGSAARETVSEQDRTQRTRERAESPMVDPQPAAHQYPVQLGAVASAQAACEGGCVSSSTLPAPTVPKPAASSSKPGTSSKPIAKKPKAPPGTAAPPHMQRPHEDDLPAGEPYEELTQPQAPSVAALAPFVAPAQRSTVPSRGATAMLNEHIACIGTEVDGWQPFKIIEGATRLAGKTAAAASSDASTDDDDDDTPEMILHREKGCKIKERHDLLYRHEQWADSASTQTVYDGWVEQLEGGRLLLDDQVLLDGEQKLAKGQVLEYVGSTDGCPLGVIARHAFGADDDCHRQQVNDALLDWLEDATEEFVFYGRRLSEWVAWELAPVSTWAQLIDMLRGAAQYLAYTAADQLLFIATAHVYAPVLVFHYRLARAVRFVQADAPSGEGADAVRGHVLAAQLPASSVWLRIGMLEHGHLVRCRTKQLASEVMLKMANERDEQLAKQVSGRLSTEQAFKALKAHASTYDFKLPDAALNNTLATTGGNLDAAIEQLGLPPRFAPDAVMVQGPSKAGKSTLLNGMVGKSLYDNTPPDQEGGDMCEPALAVLGNEIKGSQIGKDAESETLFVNPIVIKTEEENTPYLQVLDTPGQFDTRGPLVEVVNALSIAKSMAQFKTLRIVVVVRGTALEGTGEGFANTALTMKELFSKAGGAAAIKRNVLLWINPHAPRAKYNANGVVEKIKKIKAARPEITDFLKMIIKQWSTRMAVHVLSYEIENATGAEREGIVAERCRQYPQLDPAATKATKAVFPRQDLIDQIVDTPCMQNPGDKCGLPLTPPAVAEIMRQSNELVDFVRLHCERKDYAAIAHYLDVLRGLSEHMRCGAVTSSHREYNRFETAYQEALGTTTDKLRNVCSKARLAELCRPLEQAVTAADLDAISFGVRAAAAAAAVLNAHLGDQLKELTAMGCAEVVTSQLCHICDAACVLLKDHFIAGSSGRAAAHSVFAEKTRQTLSTLQQLRLHFDLECRIADGAAAAFGKIVADVDACLDKLQQNIELAMKTQDIMVADSIALGLAEAATATAQHRKSLPAKSIASGRAAAVEEPREQAEAARPPPAPAASNPFATAADALDVIKIAEEALVPLMPSLHRRFATSRDAAVAVVKQQKLEAIAAVGEMRAEALPLPKDEAKARGAKLDSLLVKLLFLLHARSSRLRLHFGAEAADGLAALDGCYEEPVGALVGWHGELVKEVVEASKGNLDNFVRTISDFRPRIELSELLASLAQAESLPLYAGAQLCRTWQQLNDSSTRLTSRIELALSNYTKSVEARLKAHSDSVARSGEGARLSLEEYDYAELTSDLELLEKARWCDALLDQSIVEPAVVGAWHAFERHIVHLAKGANGSGPGGAIDRLRTCHHMEARSLLVQIHNMLALCQPFLAGADAAGASSAYAARIKAVHDEVESTANALIAERCEKARSKVLDRAGPLGQTDLPWDWWLDLSVRDAKVVDALGHLNSLLDLSKWFLVSSSASDQLNVLDGWLQLDELERVAFDCRNRAKDFLTRVHDRARSFFYAVGGCMSSEMDEAVAALVKGSTAGAAAADSAASEVCSQASSEEDAAAVTRCVKHEISAACRELKDILLTLSRPEKYRAIFEAAREADDSPDCGSDLARFNDLSRQYHNSFIDVGGHFNNWGTEPRARQKALFAYSAFDRILPPDRAFEDFKSPFKLHFSSLQKADADARKEANTLLRDLIGKQRDFGGQTRTLVLNQRALGRVDEMAQKAYVDVCNLLVEEQEKLLLQFSLSTTNLRWPVQTFNVQKELVLPWSQLQAAKANMGEFLTDASGKEAFDLSARLADALQTFKEVWRGELAKHGRVWDAGNYADAEGSDSRGLVRMSILLHVIVTAAGGELGHVAKLAYDEERVRQRAELEQVHKRRPQLICVATMEADGSFDEQARTLLAYFGEAHGRSAAMQAVSHEMELGTEYREAAKRIDNELTVLIATLFTPLFGPEFLALSAEHINFLDGLLRRMIVAPYKDRVPSLLPPVSTDDGGDSLQVARQNIQTYRELNEGEGLRNFEAMAPEEGSSTEAVKEKIKQQGDVLRKTPASNPRFSKMVKSFNEAHASCVLRTSDLLRRCVTTPDAAAPDALDAAFVELRGRKEVAAGVQGVSLDVSAVASLERNAAMKRIELERFLLENPQSPLPAPARHTSEDDAKDAKLLPIMQTYLSLVLIAPAKRQPVPSAGANAMGSIPVAPRVPDPDQASAAERPSSRLVPAGKSTPDAAGALARTAATILKPFWQRQPDGASAAVAVPSTEEPTAEVVAETQEPTAQEREMMLQSLVSQATRASRTGTAAAARKHWLEAYELSNSTKHLLEAANEALKLDDAATAKREYEQVLQILAQDGQVLQDVSLTEYEGAKHGLEEAKKLLEQQDRTCSDGSSGRVLQLLLVRLNETLSQLHNKAETPHELASKHAALQRLQRWEPPLGASASSQLEFCIFRLAGKLQAALLAEGSLHPPQRAVPPPPPPHEERKQRVFDDLDAQIAICTDELGRADSFNWKVDAALDPKPFALLLSEDFMHIAEYSFPALKPKVMALQEAVDRAAAGFLNQLQERLKLSKHWIEANTLLERWKFFEPLAQLRAFQNLPGPNAFDKHLEQQVSELESRAMQALALQGSKDPGWEKKLVSKVLQIGCFKDRIPRAAELADEALANVLTEIAAKFGAQNMHLLAHELRESKDGALGQEIINASPAFAYVTVADFNRKTTRDESEVKRLYDERNTVDLNSNDVWERYQKVMAEYDRLLRQVLPMADRSNEEEELPDNPLQSLVDSTKRAVSADTSLYEQGKRAVEQLAANTSHDSMPKVLAGIFAWWSVAFFQELRKNNQQLLADPEKLRRPNSVQVVCILRLLGGTDRLRNHLAEVPTGEGKSVILGVLATTIALYGFHVDCACYSSMLSSRDRDAFVPMFEAFGLSDKIRYGNFESLCEHLITAQHGDVRTAMRDFLCSGSSTQHRPPASSHLATDAMSRFLPTSINTLANGDETARRVLIIDEVDVFCSEAFFGGAFSPILTIKNEEITALMRHVWSLRQLPCDIASLKAHSTYRAVMDSGVLLRTNEWLLDQAVREMDRAARSYSPKQHEHTVRDGKILYKVDGRDDYGPWSYMYETNAEYLAAFDHADLNEQQLSDGLALHVRCGEFSYAKLPSMFAHILGVTGTLDAKRLPPKMHEVLRNEVGIKAFTYCPSMFPEQKRDFQPSNSSYVQVAKNQHDHYHLIVDEIDKRLLPTTDMEGKRAVLVFFRDAAELAEFFDSSYFAKHKATAKVLTELTAATRGTRENILTAATRQGQVTLASRIYARGTDFKINDPRMEMAGGLHVISTYFSRDLSEEEQMMGRCARQGAPGSYSQVLLSKTDFEVTSETVEGWAPETVHEELSKLRRDAGAAEVQALREMAKQRKREDEELATSLKDFGRGTTGGLEKLMKRYNSFSGLTVGPRGIHVVLCLDESGSMRGEPWAELISAFKAFWETTAADPSCEMHASVVQFGSHVRTTVVLLKIEGDAPQLDFQSSGTNFLPPVQQAKALIDAHGPDSGFTAVVIFMSDGGASDAAPAAGVLQGMAQQWPSQFQSHTVGFGSGAAKTLEQMAFANGELDKNKYRAAAVGNLAEAFTAVAKSITPGRI